MAAFSGGVEWSNIVKPILSASYGSFNKHDVTDLVHSILQSEQDILTHNEKYEAFYSTFCTLAADYISSAVSAASKEEIELYCKACRILLTYLITRLQAQTWHPQSDSHSSSTLTIKQLLLPIKAFCTASSQLQRTEQFALVALMKNAKLPQHIKTSMPNIDNMKDGSSLTPTESKPVRMDLSNTIFKQLSKPLHSLSFDVKTPNSEADSVDCISLDISKQNEAFFIQKNIASLQSLQASDILIDICLNLPFIQRYIGEQKEFMQTGKFSLPSNHNEASFIRHSLQSLVNDISVIWSTLTLPVMEPLTDSKLQKLSELTLSCLYAALSTSMAMNILGMSSSVSPKTSTTVPHVGAALSVCGSLNIKIDEDNSEALAASVVEKSIVIFNHVASIIKTSTRAGGRIHQNHILLGAWLLVSGINGQISCSDKPIKDDKTKSPSKQKDKDTGRVNLLKIQQSFSVLSLALTTQALNLVTSLFEDAIVENVDTSAVLPASLNILANSSASERIAKIFEVADGLIHFFFVISPIIYRKGCSLKRAHKHNSNGDTYSAASGSTTYYEDDIMSCSDESTGGDDEDSEPILGHWFEETLSSVNYLDKKDATPSSDTAENGDKDANVDSVSIIPEKGEPTGYMTAAKDIFQFLNNHYVMCNSRFVNEYVQKSISEIDVIVLAGLIRDLDRETAMSSTSYLSLNFLYSSFSEALTLFTHNLLARNMLSEKLQNILLDNLEVNPYDTNNTTWPLLVYPRTLSVLAQIIIMRPNKETACANIWKRVINTLVEQILKTPVADMAYEDLNMEHAQLLLFLFNFLTFMEKKTALLVTAQGIVKVGKSKNLLTDEAQFFFTSRLLLFFDHIMKHLYDPPSFLLEQVQWNILGGGLHGSHIMKMMKSDETKCPWATLEDNYRQYVGIESSIKPLFYNLSTPDFNCQEIPKLDGLAVNFLLGNSNDLVYNELIEALFSIVESINVTTKIDLKSNKDQYTIFCALQYCVSLAWRMLLQLPTCFVHLEKIVSNKSDVEPSPFMLYSSIWGPRCGNKAFTGWLKDALGKQAISQPRDNLLRSVADITTRIKYDFTLLKNVIGELIPQSETAGVMVPKQDLPSFFNLLLCDTLLCKLQMAVDDSASKTNENDLNKSLDSIMTDNDNNEVSHIVVPSKSLQAHLIREMMPQMIRLAEVVFAYIKSNLLHQMKDSKSELQDESTDFTLGDLSTFQSVIAIAGCNMDSNKSKSETLFMALPRVVHLIFEKWETIIYPHFNSEPYANHAMPSISYAMTIMNYHMYALSSQPKFSINPSLKHLLYTIVRFIKDHLSTVTENEELCQKISNVIMPIAMDMSTVYLYTFTHAILEQVVGSEDSEVYQVKANTIVFEHLYSLLINYASSTCLCSDAVQEPLLLESSHWFGKLTNETYGKMAMDRFFSKHGQQSQYGLHCILLTVISQKTVNSKTYSKNILEAFNKLFAFAEKNPEDQLVKRLLSSLLRISKIPKHQLDSLFWRIIVGSYSLESPSDSDRSTRNAEKRSTLEDSKDGKCDSIEKIFSPAKLTPARKDDSKYKPIQPEHYKFLENLTNYITKGSKIEDRENLVCLLLDSIIPVANHLLENMKAFGFSELMMIMMSLADAASAKSHSILFVSATTWIQQINEFLVKEEALSKLQHGETEGDHIALINATCILFNYISDIVTALSPAAVGRATSPPWDTELLPSTLDLNADWPEELCGREDEDGDSTGDDSDEDSLSNKLCTFTVTQKEFMNQHWYHCHTCKMVDKVGVCSICARVCHRGHDVTYAKYGNFFCDCGAKSNGTCQALTKRNAQNGHDQSGVGSSNPNSNAGPSMSNEQILQSSLRRKNSSPSCFDVLLNTVSLVRSIPRDRQKLATLAKQLDSRRESFMSNLWGRPAVIDALLNITNMLVPVVEAICSRMSPVGCHKRARAALDQLHQAEKKFEYVDKLMVSALGSQEGAFENVRMNFTGDQGQTIRQLISAHLLRRVAMCCLSSPQGRRQHLVAVSHEKGKITVLQLSALLKQADSTKKKLTLSRLSSAPIPFTVLSVTGNPCNEDFLAVCGLKDCHVLTFNTNGTVADHLVLHPQLETGNFIIRAIWLPGSQTWLALVTADFVKIYDLGKDVLSPQYYFLVPTGKIRDVTFVCLDNSSPVIVIMSSVGYIYTQDMNEESSATQGPFYVTNTLRIEHPSIKDVNGQICAGGVSVYYSHILKVLLLSYAQGKSFIAFLPNLSDGTSHVYEIVLNSNSKNGVNSSSKAGSSSTSQPLCQWTEVPAHPGLVCCMLQSNNNPVVLMIKPDSILIQEIKVQPAKAKIMDMVVIRHQTTYTDSRTTLILLCEDGSLRMYMASTEHTGYWLSPVVHPATVGPLLKPSSKKKKMTKIGNKSSGSSITFPVDFFEHSTPLTEIEFGGNDLLQIYNVPQIKTRLNTPGMYVVCTKPTGFSVKITNNDTNQVITGVRVLLGNQDAQRSPSFIEVFGRTVSTTLARNRWFDVPLTREESIRADNKLTVTFGPSQDPDAVTMVDSVKVYGKMKDQFGWPDDTEEITNATVGMVSGQSPVTNVDDSSSSSVSQPVAGPLDKIVCGALEVLESCFTLMNVASITSGDMSRVVQRQSAISLATTLLTLPTPFCIILHTKSLLAALFPTRQTYHSYKDTALLTHILRTLQAFRDVPDACDLDPEAFYQLVIIARSIVVSRPQNLGRFIPDASNSEPLRSSFEKKQITEHALELVNLMVDTMWRLHNARPQNLALIFVRVPGLSHVETTVCALVEIIHSLLICDQNESTINVVIKLYLDLLLCPDTTVSFATKLAIGHGLRPKVKRRKVIIPSPTRCSTPGPSSSDIDKLPSTIQPPQEPPDVDAYEVSAPSSSANGGPLNVEAILGAARAFPAIDILQQETDDETMVELAIALSLQDHEGGPDLQVIHQDIQDVVAMQVLQDMEAADLDSLASQVRGSGHIQANETGHYSDATASAAGSDDEGSTAATDGSTLRTSPAEQAGSAESESGGSVVDSIIGEHNVSGRSSAFGDNIPESVGGVRGDTNNINYQTIGQDGDADADAENECVGNLHTLQIIILEKCIEYIPRLKDIGGIQIIPFMQVVFMLTEELNVEMDRDKNVLETLLKTILAELDIKTSRGTDCILTNPLESRHTNEQKYQLVLLRFLSVLMSHMKVASSSVKTADKTRTISTITANILLHAGVIDWCLCLHEQLLPFWKNSKSDDQNTVVGALLKPHPVIPIPDASPFFLRQYIKGHYADMFELYPQLLTEIVLRLPYQVQKHSSIQATFDQAWLPMLCEYMMAQQTPFVRRQVRKLLLYIRGSKEAYRQLRDVHALETHMKAVLEKAGISRYRRGDEIPLNISLPYDSLVEIVEHLKACVEIAMNRNFNWQNFLLYSDEYIPNLFLLCSLLDEGVSHIILQLLQYAICGSKSTSSSSSSGQKQEASKSSVATSPEDAKQSATSEEVHCVSFVNKIHSLVDSKLISKFIRTFMLETNSSNLRWQAHSLILTIFNNSDLARQQEILEVMWSMWFQLPNYGRRANQFVDLIGFFTIKCGGGSSSSSANIPLKYLQNTLSLLHSQNQVLIQHPNASMYSQLSQYVEMEGYYLESEPCLVCNNPEVPFTNVKLSSVKVDSKFTTTTQIVKLVTSHMVSKINLRIGDLKRTKMVRTMNIYYNNRSVQAVVELKNKPALWHKAKKVTLSSGQTEAKIDFPLPIVACNLMIEYVDFYENLQASTETLQCPRCSAAVPSNPGVCSNCGENVFQCHKCRAINYDEKDPFLCHVCGFCKYAKFDYTLTARQVCAIEPIDNDDDRKKIVNTINQLLEKADRTYKTLVGMKPSLENLLLKINEHRAENWNEDGSQAASTTNAQVNRAIQMLAQKYCSDCKNTFEELSRVIQKILICRKELVSYDRKQYVAEEMAPLHSPDNALLSSDLISLGKSSEYASFFKCYGCASFVVEHCLTMLRALCTNVNARNDLCIRGLLTELVEYNLRRGSYQMQDEVKHLLCLLTKDNPETTDSLCEMLMDHISIPLRSQGAAPDLAYTVRPEINLLATMLQKDDSCWEQKAKCVFKIFVMATRLSHSPPVMEAIVLPCLNIICSLIKPDPPVSKKHKDKSVESLATVRLTEDVNINVRKWIDGDAQQSFQMWKKRVPPRNPGSLKTESKAAVRRRYLYEKYFYRWKDAAFHVTRNRNTFLSDPYWLKLVLFNSGSRHARQVACNLIQSVCSTPAHQKKIVDVLTRFLSEINMAGPTASEFLSLYQSLIDTPPWKQYLTLQGVLLFLADLFNHEIQNLYHLEQTTLTSDLAQGFVLKKLTKLIASFLDVDTIKQKYKSRLVGTVLNGYLALRRLVVQRTRIIDETQEKLLELLEEMTSGTESETKAFMVICIETVEKCSQNDVRTPVFIFERLCSIIYPEENEIGEFYLSLEKDPQQEDFLQGRMLGNPYSSNEPGLGPLMRDVKNKICQDCELVALLDDDNGMELLVNNKIISLDLPVKLVYKKVWLAEGGEGDAMRVVYRMRGLLGDATEEFVETLDAKNDQEVNNEQVYKMANVMGECGGLEVMLNRLGTIRDLTRSQALLQVLLKLMGLCVKVKHNQEELIDPSLNAVSKLLSILQMCLSSDNDFAQSVLMDQILEILETILSKASSEYQNNFELYSETCGDSQHVKSILQYATSVKPSTLTHLSRVLAALTYGNKEKMTILTDHFNSVMDFESFDQDRKGEDEQRLELFCNITSSIERNALGDTLKNHIMSLGIVDKALHYIIIHVPSMKSTFWRTDSNDWKEYIAKPALKYILRFLTGLAHDHKPTQMVVSPECITIIHRLEQVASEEHVGTLAENLLEALRTNPEVATRIENVREQTRAEKKRLAMAMREKQLGALGMKTNDRGQVTAEKSVLQQMEDLTEETGLTCVICREGYRFQPTKVLGIYTFTKRCLIDDFESKSRKTYGYSTVTHFNVVHVDCHMSAVRLARVRDEWESAALQNANTRCNGLLPLWGPQVPESAFANCLARHNTYLQECTGHRDISYVTTIHDLKLLLLRFARGKSFHEDTGGGGPQSNMQIIPYLMHMALYVINTTRCASREEKNLTSYLECWIPERWIASSYEAESPFYWATFSLLLHSPAQWKKNRIAHLRRLIVLSHVRHVYPSGPHKLSDIQPKEYQVYKSSLIFYGLVDACYKYFFKSITCTSDDQWTSALADFIRHNDEALLKASEKIMAAYTEELLPCSCFGEFCDVVGLLEEISTPNTFIADVLLGLGNPAMSN